MLQIIALSREEMRTNKQKEMRTNEIDSPLGSMSRLAGKQRRARVGAMTRGRGSGAGRVRKNRGSTGRVRQRIA
jgi:hypothetical protein